MTLPPVPLPGSDGRRGRPSAPRRATAGGGRSGHRPVLPVACRLCDSCVFQGAWLLRAVEGAETGISVKSRIKVSALQQAGPGEPCSGEAGFPRELVPLGVSSHWEMGRPGWGPSLWPQAGHGTRGPRSAGTVDPRSGPPLPSPSPCAPGPSCPLSRRPVLMGSRVALPHMFRARGS